MDQDDGFMEWFIDYMNNATLDDLRKEPLVFDERVEYLRKKFEESKNEPK